MNRLDRESDHTLTATWNQTTGTPTVLAGNLSKPSKHSAEWITLEFLKRWKAIYGLQQPDSDMKIISVEHLSNKTRVYVHHLLFETPVWEDGLTVTISKQGVVQRLEGTIHPCLEKKINHRPMFPAFTETKAIEKALTAFPGELNSVPTVQRYYLPERPGIPLIYAVNLHYRRPERQVKILIHSVTGGIIQRWIP
jgi:Zn-dependent metalloprotease